MTVVMHEFADRELSVTLDYPEEREPNTLSENELRILIQALQGDASEIPLLMAMFLGMRRSEIMALEHSDYDPKTQTITITKAKVPNKDGDFVVKKPKTKKSRRKISVPPYLADKLETCIESGVPFYNVAPERPYKRLQVLCDRYNLPKMSMHDLRHQNASIMLKLGVPDKYAMERGGWSTNSVLKNIYQHTMSDARLETESKMNDYFSSIVS
jgi:integrase